MPKYIKGQSGNPAGRPKGSVSPMRKALEMNSKPLLDKALEMALSGNETMLTVLLNKFQFQIKDQLNINLNGSSKDILDDAIKEFTEGNMDKGDLNSVVSAVSTRITAIESKDMEARIAKLEAKSVPSKN